jgi:hypothetical protein
LTVALPPSDHRPWSALIAATALAASITLWSQAVITEVYALNLAFAAGLLRIGYTAPNQPLTKRRALWLGVLVGLGLGNHLTLSLLALPMLGYFFLSSASRPAAPRIIAGTFLGLPVYLYLPFVAARIPAVNWGDAGSWSGFWWVIGGAPYRGLLFAIPAVYLPGRIAAFGSTLAQQFWPWGFVLAGIGLWHLAHRERAKASLVVVAGLSFSSYAIGYNTSDSFTYLLPLFLLTVICLAEGCHWLLDWSGDRWKPWLIASLVVILPLSEVWQNWKRADLSGDGEARTFLHSLEVCPRDSIVLVRDDGPTFALWYTVYGVHERTDLTPLNIMLFDFPWYRDSLRKHHPALAAALQPTPSLATLVAPFAAAGQLCSTRDASEALSYVESRDPTAPVAPAVLR